MSKTTTAKRRTARNVNTSANDLTTLLAQLAEQGSGDDLATLATALRKTATAKKKAETIAKKANEMKDATASFASLSSELYTNKRGAKSRKVWVRSDLPGRYGKGQHETCLSHKDVAALLRIADQCGPDALVKVLRSAKAERDDAISC